MLFADNLYSYQNQLVFISLDPFLTEVSRETGGGGGWGYCWNTAGVVWSFYPKHFVLTSPLSKNAEFSKKIHRFCQLLVFGLKFIIVMKLNDQLEIFGYI